MSVSDWLKRPLNNRLLPLYIAAFSQGFVLWYPIEKLFMTSIGFNDATIGLMVAAYAAFVPFFETPSGILADRWSRKGVLVLASLALMISSLIGGLSHDVLSYIICAVFWGIFIAMYSGTYDSILYDMLLEDTGKADGFEKYLGRIRLIDSVALVAGSLLGGLFSTLFEPRINYFLTIPCILVSIIALWRFKEPKLHKSEVAESVLKHIKMTFGAVFQRGRLLQIVAIMAAMGVVIQCTLEFSQLWLVTLAAPVFLYGPANAALMAAYGGGGITAERIKIFRPIVLWPIVTLMLASSLVLTSIKNALAIIAAQVILTFLAMGLSVLFTKLLHDSLPSKVRAGAASAVSTMSWLIFLPIALLFGFWSNHQTVFRAGWLIVIIVAVGCALMVKAACHKDFRVIGDPEVVPETYYK